MLIDGEDVAGTPPHQRPTNTVFQSYALFPHLSVTDNVALGLKRKKVGKTKKLRLTVSHPGNTVLQKSSKKLTLVVKK